MKIHASRAALVQKAGKTVKNHGTFAAVICFVLTLQKADGVTTNDANP
ncbi:hypothetical protein ACE04B_12705 [Rhizobium phaseoli]